MPRNVEVRRLKSIVCAFIILIQAEMGGKINGLKATSILKAN